MLVNTENWVHATCQFLPSASFPSSYRYLNLFCRIQLEAENYVTSLALFNKVDD